MDSMLLCRTPPPCLPLSTRPRTLSITKNHPRRWRSSVSLSPSLSLFHLPSSTCTSLAWARRKSQQHLNLLDRTFQWRCQAAVDDELDEETQTAVLFVGGGVLGMETVRALLDAGVLVAAYQRGEAFDVPEMFHVDLEEMGWDVIDVATVTKILESNPFDAVVCTVGGGITRPDFDKDVPVKLVNAAKMAGVKRFVLVSVVGNGDGMKAVDEMISEVAEEAVKSSELNYTIIRPGVLLSSVYIPSHPPTGNGILTEKSGISGLISRADVAALITEVLFNKKSYGKTLTAVDEDKLLPPTSSLDGVELISL